MMFYAKLDFTLHGFRNVSIKNCVVNIKIKSLIRIGRKTMRFNALNLKLRTALDLILSDFFII